MSFLFLLIQLLSLLLGVYFLASLFSRWKMVQVIVIFVGCLILGVELFSVLMTDAFVDYKFYLHTTLSNATGVGSFFIGPLLWSVLFFILSFLFLWYLSSKVKWKIHVLIKLLLCVGFFFVMNVQGGIVSNLVSIYKIHTQKKKAFAEVIVDQKLDWLVSKDQLKGVAGKNIIILMLESVEESFLKGEFAEITPNLNRLSREMSYYPMKQVEGGDFTIGALYTYLTGWPYFFKNDGNDVFHKAGQHKIPAITNLLNDLGYEQRYLMGNPQFAGMDKMLRIFDFEVKSELDYDPSLRIDTWGLHDFDLFKLAKDEVLDLERTGKPFVLGMATISTHHPNGVFDIRVAEKYPPQKSDLELMVRAADDHIGDFVAFLHENNLYENTALFILPDHTLMGNYARVLNDFSNDRDLFLITNAQRDSSIGDSAISQLDVGKLILDGAQVQHNIPFLTDHLSGDKLDYIASHKEDFVRLNEAALTPLDVMVKDNKPQQPKPKDKYKPREDLLYFSSCAKSEEGENLQSKIYIGLDSIQPQRGVNLIIYDSEKDLYGVEHYDTYDTIENVDLLFKRLFILLEERAYFMLMVHDSAGDRFRKFRDKFANLGFPKLASIQNRQAYCAMSQFGYTSEDIGGKNRNLTLSTSPRKPARSLSEIENHANDPDRWIAHAGGAYDGKTYTNCLEAMDYSYKKGFRLFELDLIKTADHHYVAAHDWEHWKKQVTYTGPLPPVRDTFLRYKLNGVNTAMDMDAINEWFAAHPQAILVSDKVNDPEKFVPTFVDKRRLMMELFSFEAIQIAQDLGIKGAMMSDNMIDHLGSDKVAALKERGIEYMAVSMHRIMKNPKLYKSINDAGIKVYAFHINQKSYKDEGFVARHLLDYCYGSYADHWSFIE